MRKRPMSESDARITETGPPEPSELRRLREMTRLDSLTPQAFAPDALGDPASEALRVSESRYR